MTGCSQGPRFEDIKADEDEGAIMFKQRLLKILHRDRLQDGERAHDGRFDITLNTHSYSNIVQRHQQTYGGLGSERDN
jgi:hypothetical protein